MRLDFRLRSSAFAFALIVAFAGYASAQAQLPEGKGRDTVIKVCGNCHEADRSAALRLSREGWQGMIDDMKAQGATGTEAEFAEVLDYLSTHFPGEAARRLNLNTATQVQLESVAGLLRSQAATLLKYLEKNPCKELSDLKKVQGIDYKKIEERKDFLVCAPAKK